MLKNTSELLESLISMGFATFPFPPFLKNKMLQHIETHIKEITSSYSQSADLLKRAMSIPDAIWAEKMARPFRFFPKDLGFEIALWADNVLKPELLKSRSAINAVYDYEILQNPLLDDSTLAIYWRCVRPGKPDAGRPHRDSSFWELEFGEGLDPKIPFLFNYQKDCIKIWIPLEGCREDTTLQVIPGSHLMEILTSVVQTEYGRRPTISDEWLEQNKKYFMSPKELSQGSCIIFDMDLVHRGPTHQNNELRISAEFNLITQNI